MRWISRVGRQFTCGQGFHYSTATSYDLQGSHQALETEADRGGMGMNVVRSYPHVAEKFRKGIRSHREGFESGYV